MPAKRFAEHYPSTLDRGATRSSPYRRPRTRPHLSQRRPIATRYPEVAPAKPRCPSCPPSLPPASIVDVSRSARAFPRSAAGAPWRLPRPRRRLRTSHLSQPSEVSVANLGPQVRRSRGSSVIGALRRLPSRALLLG